MCVKCRDRIDKTSQNDDNDTYSFRSTGDVIMKQIRVTHPEILELFPCHITTKSAIDKNLMSLITHSAVKGIGPSDMVESLSS